MGPGFGGGCQAFADGVLADVLRFLFKAFIGAEAMVEETFLPDDAGFARGEAFPGWNQFGKIFVSRARDEGVEMVRHQKPEEHVPAVLVVIVADGSEELLGSWDDAKLVGPTGLTAEGNKEG